MGTVLLHQDHARVKPPVAASRVSLLAGGRRFWSWWLNELRGLVPARLRGERRRRLDATIRLERDLWTISDRLGQSVAIDPGDGVAVAQALDGLKGRRKQAKVAVTVPLSRCFVRHVDMPRAMLGHAGSVLGTDLDIATPFSASSVHWDWFTHGPGTAPGSCGLTQVVLKRRDTDAVRDRLADASAVLERITVEDDRAAPVRLLPVDLLRNDRRAGRDAPALRKGRRLLTGAAVLASLAVAPVAFSQQEATLAALDQDLADARDAVAPRAGLARAPLQALGRALQTKRETPPTDLVLDTLAAILPPDSALDHLFLDQTVLTIQGRTRSVHALDKALASSALFSAGHNTAPAGSGDAVPFTIRLKVKPLAPEPEA